MYIHALNVKKLCWKKQIFYYLENVSANVPVSSWLLEVEKKNFRKETKMIPPLFL